MDGGLVARAFPRSSTPSEFRHNPISAYMNLQFIDDFELIPSHPEPIIPHTDTSMTAGKDFQKQNAICNAVLNYINRVLMEDDDFENEAATIKSSKLDAYKRSFHEIILGTKDSDDVTGVRNCKYSMEEEESLINEMFSRVALTHRQNNEFSPMAHYSAIPKTIVCKREGIDMRNLLVQCMKAVAISDHGNANKLLKEIRSRASVNGDGSQRLGYYFAQGLEARLTGCGVQQHKTLAVNLFPDNDVAKAFKLYLKTFPFSETAYFFSNQTIMKLADKATSIHIISLGIMHGLQWPSLIQDLSKRPGGPPKLRITGIDSPQTGFRPDARLKETGQRLASFCTEYNVPFEYDWLAKSWKEVKLDDIRIKKGEVVVVSCMYHFMYMDADTSVDCSPRDRMLNLIKRMNPDIFIHVIANGSYNSPFFVSRFREAMFHYNSWFDMFDVHLPRENPDRMVFEKQVMGREIMNIVACEGSERVERPETYRQWQQRTIRAGFEPIPLNPNIVNEIRNRVQACYHKDIFVDEAGPWLIDGWKGRALFGASCWKPVKLD